ncbi:MAG: type II toxin-antitoxin system RelB/DinJ family antitoxin [Campylobacterales bacterium]|nr:type II toxin-antitoxin system RelB/DinJ family antitoxin [Campylobacterales bacterium]
MLSANKVRTNVYLDAEIKAKAQAIFKQYGLGLSEAFNIFLAQSVMERGIPFEVKLPNKETLAAMEDARLSRNLEHVTLEQLQDEIKLTQNV